MISNIDKTVEVCLNHSQAKQFWHNVRNHRRQTMPLKNMTYCSLHDLILHAFTWSDTPEGHDYWEAIATRKVK